MHPNHLSTEEIEKIRKLYEQGLSITQLAERFSVSPTTIRSKVLLKNLKAKEKKPRETSSVYFLESPKGERYIIKRGITEFCRQQDIFVTNIRHVCNTGGHTKGWRCFKERQNYYEYIEENPQEKYTDDIIRLQD
jgi:hypothetical protein